MTSLSAAIAVAEQSPSELTLLFSSHLCRARQVGREFVAMKRPEEPVPFEHRLPQAQIVEEKLSDLPSGTKLQRLGMASCKQWNQFWRAISSLRRYRR